MTANEFLTTKVSKIVKDGKKSSKDYEGQWYKETEDDVSDAVFGTCQGLNTQMQTMKHQWRMYRHLYGNAEAFFTPSLANNNITSTSFTPDNRLVANVSQSIVDTALAMVYKNMPHPQFFTLGEDNYKLREKAKIQNAFFDGAADNCTDDGENLYEVKRRVDLDSLVLGTGCLQVFDQEGEIRAERVCIDELLIDEVDGMFMKPQSIHRVKWVSKDQLSYIFPKKKEAIHNASINTSTAGAYVNTSSPLIEVVESFHLKSGKKAKDGLHTICIQGTALLYEEYDRPCFPYVFTRWKERPVGFWGVGLIEVLKSLQIRLNEVLDLIQRAQELVAVPIVVVSTGSDVNSDHLLANDVYREIEYNEGSTPPQWLTPTAMQSEMYQERDWLINQMFQISGVSQANATGQKPPEVKSGTAIELVADIAQGRFEIQGLQAERDMVQIAKLFFYVAAEIYKRNPKLAVRTILKGNKHLTQIPFSEIADIGNDEFGIQCFPINLLSSSPEGKMDNLMQLVQAGWITNIDAMNEMRLADLDAVTNLQTAPINLIRKILSKMINDGVYTNPVPFMDLALALKEATLHLMLAELDGVEEDNLQLVRDFINEVNELSAGPAAQQPQAQPASTQAPPASGAAPVTAPPPTISPPGAQGPQVQ